MKKLLYLAIAYQLYLVTRATGSGAESLLAARAITDGLVPYRDFMLHVGPLPAYLLAGLMMVPVEAWASLVYIAFNLLSAWGLYKLARMRFDEEVALVVVIGFLVLLPLYGGNENFPEGMLCTFGVWGMYCYEKKRKAWALGLWVLGTLVKQTGVLFLMIPVLEGFYGMYKRRYR